MGCCCYAKWTEDVSLKTLFCGGTLTLERSASLRRAQFHRNGRSIPPPSRRDRKSTRLNSSHLGISYADFCLQKKNSAAHAHVGSACAVLRARSELCELVDEAQAVAQLQRCASVLRA